MRRFTVGTGEAERELSVGYRLGRSPVFTVDGEALPVTLLDAQPETVQLVVDGEPVDYGELASHLHQTRGLPSVSIPTPYHSTWLDNTKAKFLLGWRPRYDLKRLVDEAFEYRRPDDDPRWHSQPRRNACNQRVLAEGAT